MSCYTSKVNLALLTDNIMYHLKFRMSSFKFIFDIYLKLNNERRYVECDSINILHKISRKHILTWRIRIFYTCVHRINYTISRGIIFNINHCMNLKKNYNGKTFTTKHKLDLFALLFCQGTLMWSFLRYLCVCVFI